jgi:signal transduction histidine kinase
MTSYHEFMHWVLDPAKYFLNPHSIPLFFSAILVACLGVFVFLVGRSSSRIPFAGVCAGIFFWLVFTGFGYLVKDDELLAAFWFSMDWVGVSFISINVYALALYTLKVKRPILLYFGYFVAVLFAALIVLGNPMMDGVYRYWWGFFPKMNYYGIIFLSFFFFYMANSFLEYFFAYKKSHDPVRRMQIKYMFIAFAIAYIGSVDYLPVFGIEIYPFGFFPITIFAFISGYSILRYRLWDIGFLIGKIGIYLLSSGPLALLFSCIVFFLTKDLFFVFCVIFLCLIVPVLQRNIYYFISIAKSRSGLINSGRINSINSISDRIKESGYKISNLVSTLEQICIDEFPIQQCKVLISDASRGVFQEESQSGRSLVNLHSNDSLVQYLEKNKEILVKGEIEKTLFLEDIKSIVPVFDRLDVEVAIPLIILDRVSGILFLGRKTDNKPYFVNEINRLQEIANEASTALRYVLAVSQAASETKRWAHSLNQDLKPLTEAFDFLRDNDSLYGKDPDQTEVYNQIRRPLKRLSNFLYYLTHQARIIDESLRNKYELLPVNIHDILERSISRQKSVVNKKQVQVQLQLPDNLSGLNGHARDLTIAFDAIISNALRYVPEKGSITVAGKVERDKFILSFENNGPIIPAEHLENIFTEGFQVKDGLEGTGGLGLSNVRRIVGMHGGKAWAENTGAAQGIRFIIEFPLNQVALAA